MSRAGIAVGGVADPAMASGVTTARSGAFGAYY